MQKQNNHTSNHVVLEQTPAIHLNNRPTLKNKAEEVANRTTEPNPYWVAFFAEALRLKQVAQERRQANRARQEQENIQQEGLSDRPGSEVRLAQPPRQCHPNSQRKAAKHRHIRAPITMVNCDSPESP